MDKQKTLATLEALANGIDPVSGEVFPTDSPYQDVEVVRALFHAIDLIKDSKSSSNKKVAPRQGQPWDQNEDDELVKAFKFGTSINDLAELHQRSKA